MSLLKSKSVKIILLILILFCSYITISISSFLMGLFLKPNGSQYEEAIVLEVIDGDTILLEDGRVIRYIGIDAPEINSPYTEEECFGPEATVLNAAFVEGQTVELSKGLDDKDQYDRYLRYVYVDGIFINAQMISEGAAYASRYGPEKRFHQVFTQLEQYSKLKNRGMWDVCE